MEANAFRRGRGFLLFLLLACSSLLVSASSNLQSQAGFLWVGESEGLLNLATDSGDVRFEISHPLGLAGVAVNDVNGDVWAYRKPELHAYSREGKLLTKAEAPPSIHGSDPSDMVVDGFFGNLWIAIKRDLYRFDMQGNLQQTLVMPNEIVALSLDRTRSLLWVAQRSEMRVYDADGQLTIRRELSGTPKGSSQYIYDLAYDRRNDEVWVARSDRLQRYNAAGEVTFESLGAFDGAITVDGAGGVWLARVRVLSHVNDAGSTDLQLEPFSGLADQEIMDLVADPGDASVWIASRKKLRHYAIDGEMLHDIEPTMGDGVIRTLHRAALYADLDPPEIQITAPASGDLLNHNRPTFELKYFDLGVGVNSDTIAFRSAGRLIAMSCQPGPSKAACVPLTPLPEGEVQIEATVADLVGNISEPAEVRLTIDTIPPQITVTFPPAGHITNGSALKLRGEVSEPATLSINGASVGMDAQNRFVHEALLREGDNAFVFVAMDRASNSSSQTLHVTLDTIPPTAPVLGLLAVTEPENGQVTVTGSAGSVEAGSRVSITNTRTGQTVVVVAGSDGSFLAQIAAESGDTLKIRALDAAENSSQQQEVTIASSGLPPDPASVAPALSTIELTAFDEANSFLYEGARPIQTGVAPGTIVPMRAAVIRGRVRDRTGAAVSGATVTIHYHPELGQTLSRSDGGYDMAVNGGGLLTISLSKPGYLPVHRQLDVPWGEYAVVEDVVMVRLDAQMTSVNLGGNSPLQIARGSPVADEDGSRQATLIFPSGTTAAMVFSDGTEQPVTQLSIRATEYTVGATGLKAMPAPLPANSGYTYAVELSADEAINAGAKSVTFSRPAFLYVDNFIDFPVGGPVPVGWYDRDKAAWVPADNGRVVRILSTDDGRATLDVRGDGSAATAEALAALGVTDEELGALAQLYVPGKTLWRVPIHHFTPFDCNWAFISSDDAIAPPGNDEDRSVVLDSDEAFQCKGCTIDAETQTLGEEISVGGGLNLHYRSDRVPGSPQTIDIVLSDDYVPPSLKKIELHINVAGRYSLRSFPPLPNQRYTFTWDGKDIYGRAVVGTVGVEITVGYRYPAAPAADRGSLQRDFMKALSLGAEKWIGQETDRPGDGFVTFAKHFGFSFLGRAPTVKALPVANFGGWSLDVHHAYDPKNRVLHFGDGTSSTADDLKRAAQLFAVFPFRSVRAIERTPDGSLIVVEHCTIKRLGLDGGIQLVAGNSSVCQYAGDGGGSAPSTLLPSRWGGGRIGWEHLHSGYLQPSCEED